MDCTRLAPSPTGALHLGNARSFVINWMIARQRAQKIILRIEDLDGPRIKAGADQQAIVDLQWLGINWDDGPYYQSNRTELYKSAINQLVEGGYAYPCTCSRKEIDQAASAPHAEDGANVYPGTCRGKYRDIDEAIRITGRQPAIRFRATDEIVIFHDELRGECRWNVARQLGDFVIAKSDFTPAYQLSVVVDDCQMGVTSIVRGDDLLDSTPRQILLYKALKWEDKIPSYLHLPLVVGTDGRRLAKRHGDTRLACYRDAGVQPERLLALLARWCGINDAGSSIALSELQNRFSLANLPRQRIVFDEADDQWLRER